MLEYRVTCAVEFCGPELSKKLVIRSQLYKSINANTFWKLQK